MPGAESDLMYRGAMEARDFKYVSSLSSSRPASIIAYMSDWPPWINKQGASISPMREIMLLIEKDPLNDA